MNHNNKINFNQSSPKSIALNDNMEKQASQSLASVVDGTKIVSFDGTNTNLNNHVQITNMNQIDGTQRQENVRAAPLTGQQNNNMQTNDATVNPKNSSDTNTNTNTTNTNTHPSNKPAMVHDENQSETSEEASHDNHQGIPVPVDKDILSGRGAGVNLHPGNVFFRKLVLEHKQKYIKADPGEKKRIIKSIAKDACAYGRFLKQDTRTDQWVRLSNEEVRKKVGQALRENAPAIKKKHDREVLKRKLELQVAAHQLQALPAILSQRTEMDLLRSMNPPHVNSPIGHENENGTADFTNQLACQILSNMGAVGTNNNIMPNNSNQSPTASANPTLSIIWSRMAIIQQKQEQLKRKQLELENEQSRLLQFLYSSSAVATAGGAFQVSTSSNTVDMNGNNIYSMGSKKRRMKMDM